MKLIMLVGLPGCGKSTFAKSLESSNYVIHSCDDIRDRYNLHRLEDEQKVFDILHKEILNDMKENKNIIYDSTNLTRKRRIQFLELIKDFDCEKICYMFIVPVEICKNRNLKIKDYEYDIMLNGFNPPLSDEGWDRILYEIHDSNIVLL